MSRGLFRLGRAGDQIGDAFHGRLQHIAHEIGNPIAAIMGMHDLIADDQTDDETRADFLRRMRKETERINVVVRDLLDYARPGEESPVSIRAVSRRIHRPRAETRRMTAPSLGLVSAHSSSFSTARMNASGI